MEQPGKALAMQVETVAELREIQRLLKKMATKDDMYSAWKGARQTSI